MTKAKGLIREYLPFLYPIVYRMYFRFANPRMDRIRLAKYSRFVRRGFYPFELGDVHFDIMLDPSNGGVDMDIFADKFYESRILEVLRDNLSKDAVLIDIGSNIGQHSLYCSYFCKHVYSFEPIRKLHVQFSESIFKNCILNITALRYALGNEKKESPIYSTGTSIAASSLYRSKHKSHSHAIENIKILRLDDSYQAMGIDRADLLKIDVEGYELEVLLGAKLFIQKYRPTILLEFSPYFYKKIDANISQKILDFLSSEGYSIADLDEYTGKRVPIRTIDDLLGKDQTNLLCTI